jgi:formylglycine-generating enzyme required for sulfatase activity
LILSACGAGVGLVPTSTPPNTPVPTDTAAMPTANHTPINSPIWTPTSTVETTLASTIKPAVTLPVSSSNEIIFELAPGVQITLLRVPAGEFLMGGDSAVDKFAKSDEKPQHQVTLAEYWIGKYEVTNRQYKAFVDATGHNKPYDWKEGSYPTGKENYPVVYIYWQDAIDFCNWATSLLQKLEPELTLRLPTEAEWEKAARGTDGRIYPWGNQDPTEELANVWPFTKNLTEVGKYPKGASPYGAEDMAGNASERVSDWYDENYYTVSPSANPTGPTSGTTRVIRGGSAFSEFYTARTAERDSLSPTTTHGYYGFRVAAAP